MSSLQLTKRANMCVCVCVCVCVSVCLCVLQQGLLDESRSIDLNFQAEAARLEQMTRQLEQQHISEMQVLQNARRHIEMQHEARRKDLIEKAQHGKQVSMPSCQLHFSF